MTEKKPALIITCGLMGSGKSTIADLISERKAIPVIRSDVVRKELAGIMPAEHRYEGFGKGIYSPEFTERTYDALMEKGRKILEEGRGVILDAAFGKRGQRKKARRLAKELGVPFLCVETVCSDEETKNRLDRREKRGGGISDGRWEIFHAQKEGYEKINEFSDEEHMRIDSTLPKEVCVRLVSERIERIGK